MAFDWDKALAPPDEAETTATVDAGFDWDAALAPPDDPAVAPARKLNSAEMVSGMAPVADVMERGFDLLGKGVDAVIDNPVTRGIAGAQERLINSGTTAGNIAAAALAPFDILVGGDSPIAKTERENRHKVRLEAIQQGQDPDVAEAGYRPQGPVDPLVAEKVGGSLGRIGLSGPLAPAVEGVAKVADIAMHEPEEDISSLKTLGRAGVASAAVALPMKAGAMVANKVAGSQLGKVGAFGANAAGDFAAGYAAGVGATVGEKALTGQEITAGDFAPSYTDAPFALAAGLQGMRTAARGAKVPETGSNAHPEATVLPSRDEMVRAFDDANTQQPATIKAKGTPEKIAGMRAKLEAEELPKVYMLNGERVETAGYKRMKAEREAQPTDDIAAPIKQGYESGELARPQDPAQAENEARSLALQAKVSGEPQIAKAINDALDGKPTTPEQRQMLRGLGISPLSLRNRPKPDAAPVQESSVADGFEDLFAKPVKPVADQTADISDFAPKKAGEPQDQWPDIPLGGGTTIRPTPIASGKPLHRETNISGLDDLLFDDDSYRHSQVWVTDNPDLALGQFENKGIRVTFRPDSVSGRRNATPGTSELTGFEYVTNALAPKAIQEVVVSKDAYKSLRGLTRRRLDRDFARTEQPDGTIKFTRKASKGLGLSPLNKGGATDGLQQREVQGETASGPVNTESQEIAATPEPQAGMGVINLAGEQGAQPPTLGMGQLSATRGAVSVAPKPKHKGRTDEDPDVQAMMDVITTSKDPRNRNVAKFTDRLRTELFDQFRPIQRISEAAAKAGKKLKAIEDPYKIFRGLNRNTLATVNKAMTKGFEKFGGDGQMAAPSLREVLAPVADRMEKFNALLMARRVPEMAKRQQNLPVDPEQAARATEKMLAEPGMSEALEKYDQFTDAGLQYALDSGFMKAEDIAKIREANQLYAPWERVDEDGNIRMAVSPAPGKRPDQPGNPLKKVTEEGSTKNIVSPLETSVKNVVQIVSAAQKNAAKLRMVDLVNEMPDQLGAFAQKIDADKAARLNPGEVMVVRRNGEMEHYRVDPEIRKTLDGLTHQEMDTFDNWMRASANFFRGSVTLDPPFAANNLFRDMLQQTAISRSGLGIPGENQLRGLGLLMTKKGRNTWREWQESAGNQAIEYGAIMDRGQLIDDMTKQAKRTPHVIFDPSTYKPKNWAKALNKVMQTAESVGRVGEYDRVKKQSLKKGYTEAEARAEAEFESADLGDFSMRGRNKKVAAARQYIPFLGANMSFSYREVGAMKSPKALVKGAVIFGGMEMLNFALNHDDPNYWNLPEDQRQRYWHFPLPNGKFFAFPKPVGVISALFTEPVRFALDRFIAGDGNKTLGKLAMNMLETATPPLLPQMLRAGAETMIGDAGYSFFYDRPIVNHELQTRPDELQYTDRTSLTARGIAAGANQLGKVGINAGPLKSPQKVDYMIGSGLGPGVRRIVETGVDPLISKVTGQPVPGQQLGPSLTKRNYFNPEDKGSEAIDRFYTELDRARKAKKADSLGEDHEGYSKPKLKRMEAKAEKLSKMRDDIETVTKRERAALQKTSDPAEKRRIREEADKKRREIKRKMTYEVRKYAPDMPEKIEEYKSRLGISPLSGSGSTNKP